MGSLPMDIQKLFRYLDANKETYINDIKESIAIESVSLRPNKRSDCVRMMHWMEQRMQKIGAKIELCDIGSESVAGDSAKLPPLLIGHLPSINPNNKKTLLIYGHLDVQPAYHCEGWSFNPWKITESKGKLYGRGISDNKGPTLAWIHAIETFQNIKMEIPVNIKFIFECMQEAGSVGLEHFIFKKRNIWFNDIDLIAISDSYWLGNKKPCIIYGLRGLCHFCIEISGPKDDLHSGAFGGVIDEPMTDLIILMSSLVDVHGRIKIAGFTDEMLPITPDEERLYRGLELDVKSLREQLGVKKLAHNEEKSRLLMHRWRFPTLTFHGIQGAYSEEGARTIIPGKVIGKFSIRTVPNQKCNKIEKLVRNHLEEVFSHRKSSNSLKITMTYSLDSWYEEPKGFHITAAQKACKHVYKTCPDIVRDGASLPTANIFQNIIKKPVILLPLGSADAANHTINEHWDVKQFMDGHKLLASFLYELGH